MSVIETIKVPSRARKAFVFMLMENYNVSMRNGIIGHDIKVQTPNDYREGKFFIGVSWRMLVAGPFLQANEQYIDKTKLGFVRRIYSWETQPHTCEHRFRFQSALSVPITMGITWSHLCDIAKISPYTWANLHQLEITDEQFQIIESRLTEANLSRQRIAA